MVSGGVPTPAAAGRGKTVLLVEDEPMARKLAQMALGQIPGLSVIEAVDGDQASEVLNSAQVDLVILDLHLPTSLSGLDLLHNIRAGEFRAAPDLPVVVVTGTGTEVTETIARAMGVADFLHKPVKAAIMREVAEKALG